MSALEAYLLGLNTLLVVCAAVIAIYFVRSYNTLVRGAIYTTAPNRADAILKFPAKTDTIEVTIQRDRINLEREKFIRAGYSIIGSHSSRGVTTLTMTKRLNGGNSI